MRRPEWIDVVLEGGGLELERSVLESRRLRTLLTTDWKTRAPEMAALASSVARIGFRAEESLAAAHRRLRQEPGRVELEALCAEVTREWDALERAVDAALGADRGPGGRWVRLETLADRAQDEALFLRAHVRLRRERVVTTGAAFALALLPPVLSWLEASELGVLPTKLDLAGLASSDALRVASLVGLAALVAMHSRALSWRWLGVGVPSTTRVVGAGFLAAVGTLLWLNDVLAATGQGILTALVVECAEVLVLLKASLPALPTNGSALERSG